MCVKPHAPVTLFILWADGYISAHLGVSSPPFGFSLWPRVTGTTPPVAKPLKGKKTQKNEPVSTQVTALLTCARSKPRLCWWKAAELLSAGRIKTWNGEEKAQWALTLLHADWCTWGERDDSKWLFPSSVKHKQSDWWAQLSLFFTAKALPDYHLSTVNVW